MKIDKDNTGLLFPNHKKSKESDPNTKGLFLVDGVEYWASGWTNTDNAGHKYIKIALKPKNENGSGSVQKKLDTTADDDVPF